MKRAKSIILKPGVVALFLLLFLSNQNVMAQADSGIQELKVGEFKVQKLQDAEIYLNISLLSGIEKEEALKLSGGKDSLKTPVNVFLIRTGKQNILIDAGIGKNGGENAVHLEQQLKMAGVSPADINMVLLTHFHFDHKGGLLTTDGKRFFPNAVVRASKTESDFWLKDISQFPENQRERASQIRRALDPYIKASAYSSFLFDEKLADGIFAIPAFGHTVGHTMYSFTSGKNVLWCIGDLIHFDAIQFEKPKAGVVFDTNGETAIQNRLIFFDRASKDHITIAGSHLPMMIEIEKAGESYTKLPAFSK